MSGLVTSHIFDDNHGPLLLSTKYLITNKTMNFLVKQHFFWHHLHKYGNVQVLKIPATG
jgi:hypothetical protein